MAKRQSAFNKALQEAQKKEPEAQLDSETVSLSNCETGKQSSDDTVVQSTRETVKSGLEKTSFYISHKQLDKLDDMAHEYKKRTGKRINRNDIVRHLIDQVDLESLIVTLTSNPRK
jgi:hypothetical protein